MENSVSVESPISGAGHYPIRGSMYAKQAVRPVRANRQARERHRYQEIDTEGRPATCLVWFD